MSAVDKASRPLPELLEAGDDVAGLYSSLQQAFESEKSEVASAEALKGLRDRWLGRKNGLLTFANDNWLKLAPRELKPQVGKLQNETRKAVEAALEEAQTAVSAASHKREAIDVTLPGPSRTLGAKHPVRLVLEECIQIFKTLGYSVAEGPEIETFFYNFEALNFPADHPAVDEMDTLFVEDKMLLRTHTSPCQIRIMEASKPPLRYVVHGKVYRNDAPDATHSPMFHQLEVFAVGESITLGDLKGTLEYFARQFFGEHTKTRFRPSFFPFTEPSAEVDVTCPFCQGLGCRICKQTGWIEVLGCGMIDPNVLRAAKLDPTQYQGFAAGFGLDRFAMLKYDINDISLLYNGDVRFLRQFR
ncbi:MAG: phenylalanine--tRNA ligase subunit alpha [Bryobacterales bacterium]|nr:phenylalanine--tRNA ligase subunit alpha [Acidobacteriota bacterium]MCB9384089.1 phenylalanine--tRNA ligase subunit alpha [Bryobacterales bacterium]